jgi:hypothetical protein
MARVSELYQLDPPITVDFDSVWKQNVEQMDAELEKLENEASSQLDDPEEGGDDNEGSESESEEDVSAD